MPKHVKLSEYRERKEAEGAIDVETDDGQVFRIPPPELWPDNLGALAREGKMTEMGEALLGADAYRRFCEAGGSALILNGIFAESNGIDVGER